jgi:hypothetical protein
MTCEKKRNQRLARESKPHPDLLNGCLPYEKVLAWLDKGLLNVDHFILVFDQIHVELPVCF